MTDYDDTHTDNVCLACSVIGCTCDEYISGCENEVELKRSYALARIEKTYDVYRAYLDADVRDYACSKLRDARQAYLDASDELTKL